MVKVARKRNSRLRTLLESQGPSFASPPCFRAWRREETAPRALEVRHTLARCIILTCPSACLQRFDSSRRFRDVFLSRIHIASVIVTHFHPFTFCHCCDCAHIDVRNAIVQYTHAITSSRTTTTHCIVGSPRTSAKCISPTMGQGHVGTNLYMMR